MFRLLAKFVMLFAFLTSVAVAFDGSAMAGPRNNKDCPDGKCGGSDSGKPHLWVPPRH